jgi:hypothetical protein
MSPDCAIFIASIRGRVVEAVFGSVGDVDPSVIKGEGAVFGDRLVGLVGNQQEARGDEQFLRGTPEEPLEGFYTVQFVLV